MSNLRTTITDLASQFAAGVLSAIRGASLEDILAETNRSGGEVRRGPGRPRGTTTPVADDSEKAGRGRRGRRTGSGRLGRRSADDIGAIVERIVQLLNQSPNGLRAEEIRRELDLEAKELPRPIAEALSSKRIIKQGQKRATTYFARGKGGAGAGAPKRGAAKAGGAKRGPGRPAKKGKRGAAGKRGRKASAPASEATQDAGTGEG